MTYHRGFAPFLVLIVIAVLAGGAIAAKNGVFSPASEPRMAGTQSEQTFVATYALPKCGVTVSLKKSLPVHVSSATEPNAADTQWLYVGEPMPNSILMVSCMPATKWPEGVASFLDVQSAGSRPVDKEIYSVFDQQTLTTIDQLYSAKDRGYRTGSDTLGFQANGWVYEFSFKDPQHARNKDTFLISVAK